MADVGRVRPVPVQMWTGVRPIPAQTWAHDALTVLLQQSGDRPRVGRHRAARHPLRRREVVVGDIEEVDRQDALRLQQTNTQTAGRGRASE